MNILNKLFKKENEFDPSSIKRQARKIGNNLADMTQKYDERTEEVIELLREKSEGLWDCKMYYDGAMQLKGEVKSLKAEKSDKAQETMQVKKQWGELALYMIKNNICKKPTSLKELVIYLQFIQYIDKEELSIRSISTMMKKFNLTKEDIEKDYIDVYNNLKMKDW